MNSNVRATNGIRITGLKRNEILFSVPIPASSLFHTMRTRSLIEMDIIGVLILAFVRDVICQGTGALLVALYSGGSLIADRCDTTVTESEVRRVNGMLYIQGDERHIEWWAVFGIGVAFWFLVFLFFSIVYAAF